MIIGQTNFRSEFSKINIRIFKKTDSRAAYPVEMEIVGKRRFEAVPVKIDQVKLRALSADPKAYGLALGKMVFGKKALYHPYLEARAALQNEKSCIHVAFQVDPAELTSLYWERIYTPIETGWRPMGSDGTTPFSRFIPPQDWKQPSPIAYRPIRILVVISSPKDLEESCSLDPITLEEREAFRASLTSLPETEITWLESGTTMPPTLDLLRGKLQNGYQIIHFLCHGQAAPAGTVLFLEDAFGNADPILGERVIDAFGMTLNPPVFCFFSACESAARYRKESLLPLGPALVEQGGAYATVAMSDKVGTQTALAFTEQFYKRLYKHGLVDLAVNEARSMIQDEWDWGVPVLFSRLENSQLLDFPIGGRLSEYFGDAHGTASLISEGMQTARHQNAFDKVQNMFPLIIELNKSHESLVELSSQYRDIGDDPENFEDKFKAFQKFFTIYYDKKSWISEQTSCNQIRILSASVLNDMNGLLPPDQWIQLKEALNYLSDGDASVMMSFQGFVEGMYTAMNEINKKLKQQDLEGAIEQKLDFEAQITPSFRRSKEFLREMGQYVTKASAV